MNDTVQKVPHGNEGESSGDEGNQAPTEELH